MARNSLLTDWGPEVLQRPEEDLLILFFDSLRRRPVIRERTLWIADDFQCPQEVEQGWKQLQQKITAGDDLRPHLSRRHRHHDTLDGLLNEWGVHHLHLGTMLPPGDPFIERTGPILFARITATDFYAINIYSHGAWEDTTVLESLHRNWPESIRRYRIRGIQGEPLTETQRRNLRKGNLQTATAPSDGTVYMAISGGVASSGTSAQAVMRADMLWSDADLLQKAVQGQFDRFLPHLHAGGYTEETVVNARLVDITPQAFQVAFPEYGVLANVTLEGGWFHRRPWEE